MINQLHSRKQVEISRVAKRFYIISCALNLKENVMGWIKNVFTIIWDKAPETN